MSTWLSTGDTLVAAAIPVVGAIYTFTANRRAQYDRVLALTAESGTSPVSDDRHVLGIAFEPLSSHPAEQPLTLTQDQIKALFNVLWYAQRVDAVYRSLRSPLRPRRVTRTQAILLDSLGSTLSIWREYLDRRLLDPAGREIRVSDSSGEMLHLSTEYERLRARRNRGAVRRRGLILPGTLCSTTGTWSTCRPGAGRAGEHPRPTLPPGPLAGHLPRYAAVNDGYRGVTNHPAQPPSRSGAIHLPSWSCGFDSRRPLSCFVAGQLRAQAPAAGIVAYALLRRGTSGAHQREIYPEALRTAEISAAGQTACRVHPQCSGTPRHKTWPTRLTRCPDSNNMHTY
jgi:hypothetical protein